MARVLCIAIAAVAAVVLTDAGVIADVFEPTDDAYTSEPDGGIGTGSRLQTRNRYGADGPGYEANTYLRFDLSAIPPSSDVTSAVLYLYYYDWQDTNPAGRELTAYRVEGAWDEETITWDTQPPEAEEVWEPTAAEEEGGGTGRLAVRVGEAAAAAVALAAFGGLLILWRRRARI